MKLPVTGVTGCSCEKWETFYSLKLAASLAAHSEARDGLLSICAALNLLLQQVFCRPVDVHSEPSGYRLITVNEIHNSGLRNLKTHTQQNRQQRGKNVLLIQLNYSRKQDKVFLNCSIAFCFDPHTVTEIIYRTKII